MLIEVLYERLTGRPYWTGRSCAAEKGPPPGALYAAKLAAYSDMELVMYGPEIVAALRERDRMAAKRHDLVGV